MKDGVEISSSFNSMSDVRLVRAMIYDTKERSYLETSFVVEKIERLRALGNGCSVMILNSGFEIQVALPLRELENAIHFPTFRDSARYIDLCGKTGRGYENDALVIEGRKQDVERARRDAEERKDWERRAMLGSLRHR